MEESLALCSELYLVVALLASIKVSSASYHLIFKFFILYCVSFIILPFFSVFIWYLSLINLSFYNSCMSYKKYIVIYNTEKYNYFCEFI